MVVDPVWSRRRFMEASGAGLSALWLLGLSACGPMAEEAGRAAARGDAFTTFEPQEGAQLEEIAALILPSDDGPGAREAGAAHFIDRAFGAEQADSLGFFRSGLADVGERARSSGAPSGQLAELPAAARIEVLRAVEAENADFFGYVHFLVLLGTFSHPDWGGNRDHVGWAMVGLEHADTYAPPYGFYDAEANGGAS
ncbi:MAG: gluconate 2-dehydrogenase subunit 3 family protein [Gemmatimonadota bacterium]|nr:gluconate 2-dehydrogenase subunit 3 family protein [Gemmatimonadota bacterium]